MRQVLFSIRRGCCKNPDCCAVAHAGLPIFRKIQIVRTSNLVAATAARSERVNGPGPVSGDITWHTSKVSPTERAALQRQNAATLWLTGLSASGKSTLAYELERRLHAMGHASFVLDGDNIRHGLSADLGFAPEHRKENIRRIAEVAKLINDAGIVVLTAFISPYREDREVARRILGNGRFIETHVAADLAVCEKRDPRGLYRKARAGELPDFTGVSAPYEEPLEPELVVDTGRLTVGESVAQLLDALIPRLRQGHAGRDQEAVAAPLLQNATR